MLGKASKIILFPYWVALSIRNRLYDKGKIQTTKFDIPVICVGNITAGGTGKTPHTELIASALRSKYRVAVISLGYKRATKGFRIVKLSDDYKDCGDEPLQIKKKFPEIVVAVCKEREVAIKKVIDEYGVNLIILDDAFQYRKVSPSCNVLLINYNKSIVGDNLLPIGSLRDLPSQIKRADAVVITKSPNFTIEDGNENFERALEFANAEELRWRKELGLKEHQKIYFSTLYYNQAQPVFPGECNVRYLYSKFAVCFSGIANDYEFRSQIVATYKIEGSLKFADHKNFSKSDIKKIVELAKKQPEAAIMTTEKDSMRLKNNKWIPQDIKARMFALPVACKIIPPVKADEFFDFITQHNIANKSKSE